MERRRLRADESFDRKYRPQTWREVIGQDETVRSVRELLDNGRKRCFLFFGPRGVGKTSVARLIVRHVGCLDGVFRNYWEIDGGIHNGIDDVRRLIEGMQYRPSGSPTKVICVDELHCLSVPAMQALLKSVEEPPSYGYWIFCTTKLNNILDTLIDRCAFHKFMLVPAEYIVPRLLYVSHVEGLRLERAALCRIATSANGSPRRALTNLEKCRHLRTLEEVDRLLALS